MSELVEVTQEDRDAAADLSELIAGKSNGRDQIAECRAGKQDEAYLVQAFARHRIAAHAKGYAEGLEAAAVMLDERIAEGYPTPANKVDQCPHGKFGWEDCIACYDEALTETLNAIRSLRLKSLKE